MNDVKQKWEEVYEREDLPWLKNPIPLNILDEFASQLKSGDKVLDYGGGDGILSKVLLDKGLELTCSDISEKALALARQKSPEIKTIQASNPFTLEGKIFAGLLVWGVMHHVDKKEWLDYLLSFNKLLQKNGLLLIGSHSTSDKEFNKGYRISPTTGYISYAINDIEKLISEANFTLENSGFFKFEEAFSKETRVFKYFFLRKNN